jgi:hypothetical protein
MMPPLIERKSNLISKPLKNTLFGSTKENKKSIEKDKNSEIRDVMLLSCLLNN